MKSPKDLSGIVFGRLTVINKSLGNLWLCRCECGNLKEILRASLISEKTKSCGCLRRELRTKHGMSKTLTYQKWESMKSRCHSKNSNMFKWYLDKGITYDKSWENFEQFYFDMGECPEGMTLDRINSKEGYNKENCRWTTHKEQAYNTGLSENNNSGKSGVHYYDDKWIASIRFNGKLKTLYYGDSFEDACLARQNAEILEYGYIKE